MSASPVSSDEVTCNTGAEAMRRHPDLPPKQKNSPERTPAGALRIDINIRLKGDGLIITRAQVAAAIASLATLGWAVMHFH